MSDPVRDAIAAGLAALTPVTREPLASLGYGTDLVCVDDLTARLDETDPNDVRSVAQDLYHRLTTSRGTQAIGDANYGINVLEFLSQPATPELLRKWVGDIRNELRKDDRVSDVAPSIRVLNPKELEITILVTPVVPTAANQFSMILELVDGDALLKEILT